MSDEAHSGSLEGRLSAVELWLSEIKRLIIIGDMARDAAWDDLRALAVNYILRRQLEALDATVALARVDLGHLAVAYVRPALDEFLWLAWTKDLTVATSNELLAAMGRSDAIRSLLAQRAYVGDTVMNQLWYPSAFLDDVATQQTQVKSTLASLRSQFAWAGSSLPTAAWVADQTGKSDLYSYLHAAASRALHFSMGEVMRNAWGAPIITTRKVEFREYRTAFALYQLPVLFLETTRAAAEYFTQAGVTSSEAAAVEDDLIAAAELLGEYGRVPLVHAHEWNLTPGGPLSI